MSCVAFLVKYVMYVIIFAVGFYDAKSKGDRNLMKRFAHKWGLMCMITVAEFKTYVGYFIYHESHRFTYLIYQVLKFGVYLFVDSFVEVDFKSFETKYRLEK